MSVFNQALMKLLLGESDPLENILAGAGPASGQNLEALMKMAGMQEAPTGPVPDTGMEPGAGTRQVPAGSVGGMATNGAPGGTMTERIVNATKQNAAQPTGTPGGTELSEQDKFIQALAGIEAPEGPPPPTTHASSVPPRLGGSLQPNMAQLLLGGSGLQGGAATPPAIPSLAALLRGAR